MADPNVGQIVTQAWEAIVKADPQDNIFEDYWLLDRIKSGKAFRSFDGGRLLEAHLEYATNTTVSSISELETMSTTRVDVFDSAQYTWKIYAGTVNQSEYEDAVNQGSGGKFDLLAAKLRNLKNSCFKTFNEDLFGDGTGNSGKDMLGLGALVPTSPSSGTVGGISRSTFSFWRSIAASGAATTAAYDNLRAQMRSVYNQCSQGIASDHPEFGVTDRTTFEGFEGLLLANERFTGKDDGDGGFKNEVLKFKGMKLAYDNDCTSGYLYFLNSKYLGLGYLKGRWMKMFDAVDPANQATRIFKTLTIAQAYTTQSRRLGVVYGIT